MPVVEDRSDFSVVVHNESSILEVSDLCLAINKTVDNHSLTVVKSRSTATKGVTVTYNEPEW